MTLRRAPRVGCSVTAVALGLAAIVSAPAAHAAEPGTRTITVSAASSLTDVMPQIAGRADGSYVSQLVREKLA